MSEAPDDLPNGSDIEQARELLVELGRLRGALEEIACRDVSQNPLWWQVRARNALSGRR